MKTELGPEDQNGPGEEGVRLLHMPALAASFLTCFVVQIERHLPSLGIDHHPGLNFAQTSHTLLKRLYRLLWSSL